MTTSYAFISSMNKNYFDKCGKLMLDSFNEYNPKHKLYLYNEDFSPNYDNVILQGWNLGKEYEEFQSCFSVKSSVYKFAKKGFSIIHAMNDVKCDYLIWIDADCEIKQNFNKKFLKSITNKNILSSHFSVWHNKNNRVYHSCETGFFVLNKNHYKFSEFKKIYSQIYINQEVELIRRLYDGEVYGETVRRLTGDWMNNLNPGRHKTPIPRSIIKDYISHYKGKSLKDSIFN